MIYGLNACCIKEPNQNLDSVLRALKTSIDESYKVQNGWYGGWNWKTFGWEPTKLIKNQTENYNTRVLNCICACALIDQYKGGTKSLNMLAWQAFLSYLAALVSVMSLFLSELFRFK